MLCFRTEKEKETSGIPDIPNSGRLIELEYAAISDRKIRSQLRDPNSIEKTVRAKHHKPLAMLPGLQHLVLHPDSETSVECGP